LEARNERILYAKTKARQVLSSGFWNPLLLKVLPFDHGRKGFCRLLEFNWLRIKGQASHCPKMTQITTIHGEDFLPAPKAC
jgi:hypothetical protein